MHQLTIRLDDKTGQAFREACRNGFRGVQDQARKYIIEGLRRDGLLTDAEPRSAVRRKPQHAE